MELAWYTYFSWWVFIWFLIFKMNLTDLSPYLVYLGVVTFIFFKFSRDIIYFTYYDEDKVKNFDLILAWVLFVLVLDIIPFFYLEKQIDVESIFFTLFLGLAYCMMMNIWKINIKDHYAVINYRELSDKYTTKSFFKAVFVI